VLAKWWRRWVLRCSCSYVRHCNFEGMVILMAPGICPWPNRFRTSIRSLGPQDTVVLRVHGLRYLPDSRRSGAECRDDHAWSVLRWACCFSAAGCGRWCDGGYLVAVGSCLCYLCLCCQRLLWSSRGPHHWRLRHGVLPWLAMDAMGIDALISELASLQADRQFRSR
jgi:hypothetical protein